MSRRIFTMFCLVLIFQVSACTSPTPTSVIVSTSIPSLTLTPSPLPSATPTTSLLPDLTGMGVILFTGKDGSLWQVNADGSNPHVSTFTPHIYSSSMESYLDFDNSIYIHTAVGEGQFTIGPESLGYVIGIGDAVWSPDGNWIAFKDHELDLHVVGSDGRGYRQLTQGNSQRYSMCSNLVWSPDGGGLAYTCFGESDWFLMLQPVDLVFHPVTLQVTGWLNSFCWTPDLNRVVFSAEYDLNPDDGTGDLPGIYGLETATGDVRLLWLGEATGLNMAPQGNLIAFSGIISKGHKIAVMNATTFKVTALTDLLSIDTHPSWSPDGKYIVFSSTTGRYGLFVVRVFDHKIRQLLNFGSDPTWYLMIPGTE